MITVWVLLTLTMPEDGAHFTRSSMQTERQAYRTFAECDQARIALEDHLPAFRVQMRCDAVEVKQ